MDLERGFIKALFYEYPLDRFLKIVEGELNKNELLGFVPEILCRSMPAFDIHELRQTIEAFSKKWNEQYIEYEPTIWPLLYVPSVAEKLLILENNKPRIKKEQLFRWRMISLPVSEDLLVLSWLAWRDKERDVGRDNFVWEDTINVEVAEWRKICGSKGLYDLHSHLGASSDAFNIRWIYWMNHKVNLNEKKFSLVGVAMTIRYYLFEICNGGTVPEGEKEIIFLCASCGEFQRELIGRCIGRIGGAKSRSRKPNIGTVEHWDYAIKDGISLPKEDLKSPYMLHTGERFIMYEFLRLLYRNDERAVGFAECFYIYLLIKTHYRKKFVQTNELVGLSNYQRFEQENQAGVENMSEARKRYALQTALGTNRRNYVESRISWEWDKEKNKSPIPIIMIEQCLFGNEKENKSQMLKRVGLIVSYSKNDFQQGDKANELHKLVSMFEEVIKRVSRNKVLEGEEFSVVGIDFTGSDEKARPETYAQLVRYARSHTPISMKNFTYHVGEDFYDLLDGLRAIDEVLRYLKWDKNCRLGHALALGTSPFHYYEKRGWNVIATKQVLLDNLVWYIDMSGRVGFSMGTKQKSIFLNKIKALYKEIGYSEPFELTKYSQSMLLRGDHPVGEGRMGGQALFVQTALEEGEDLDAIRRDKTIKAIFDEYYADKNIRQRGDELTFGKMPKFIINGIRNIQQYLLQEIRNRGIAIESCPTSNYMIGYFDEYIDLPLFYFQKELPKNAISINTDDKGIVATSIENEYALISMAMSKSKKYKSQREILLKRFREDAKKSRFKM